MLDTLDRLTGFDYLCRLNMIIGSEDSIYGDGKIRAYDVRIAGTNWQPQIPFEYDVRNEMADILKIESEIGKAIHNNVQRFHCQILSKNCFNITIFKFIQRMIINHCSRHIKISCNFLYSI